MKYFCLLLFLSNISNSIASETYIDDENQKRAYIPTVESRAIFVKQALIPAVAFSSDRVLFHPFENLISHMQKKNLGTFNAIHYINKHHGLGNYYKGFAKPFFTFTPARVAMYSGYSNLKEYFIQSGFSFNQSAFVSSLFASGVDATLTCPGEVTRVRASLGLTPPRIFSQYYHGYGTHLLRSLSWVPLFLGGSDYLVNNHILPSPLDHSFFAGFLMGATSQAFMVPVDGLKNAVMADGFKSRNHHFHILKIYRDSSYYRGFLVRLSRMSLSSGIVFSILHTLREKYDQI